MFVVMEDLVEKLKLLRYEEELLRKSNLKPPSRHYFALPTNPGEQFYMFCTLAAWLINKTGRTFEQPQEYDDPNATISNILSELRSFGRTADFPPSKLKSGYGEHVCYVLDCLAEEALKYIGFTWKRPSYPVEELEEETVPEDDAELTLSKVDEEFVEEETDNEENFIDLNVLKAQTYRLIVLENGVQLNPPEGGQTPMLHRCPEGWSGPVEDCVCNSIFRDKSISEVCRSFCFHVTFVIWESCQHIRGGSAGTPIHYEAYRITATLFCLHNADVSLSNPSDKEMSRSRACSSEFYF
ncbi:Intraflagellar transport protein 57-like [Cricetulus griseus]|uniref:Intraflagellar transport protein 57 homolog n=1 Tax=Cricetulus griseus TaxID=10029 RepID=G3H7C5_CRIGR|nr:Intraflagellar transport protein 57-like [Cricetulus griseus]